MYGLTLSPDGKWAAFFLSPADLWVLDLKQKGAEPELRAAGPEIFSATWSPDSRWIAYERHDPSGMGDIFVAPATGGEPINLTEDPGHDQQPFWDQRGERLGFESDRRGSWDIFEQIAASVIQGSSGIPSISNIIRLRHKSGNVYGTCKFSKNC